MEFTLRSSSFHVIHPHYTPTPRGEHCRTEHAMPRALLSPCFSASPSTARRVDVSPPPSTTTTSSSFFSSTRLLLGNLLLLAALGRAATHSLTTTASSSSSAATSFSSTTPASSSSSLLLGELFLAASGGVAAEDVAEQPLEEERRGGGRPHHEHRPHAAEEEGNGGGLGAEEKRLHDHHTQAERTVKQADDDEACGKGAGEHPVHSPVHPPLVVKEVRDAVHVVDGVRHLPEENTQADGEVGELEVEGGEHVNEGGDVVGDVEHGGREGEEKPQVCEHVR
mmetsp:Transcript_12316/g.24535  ORF Transcript_12316/g.24535 Transcript_12316/m.24535 type:complete len:281 (-) Transcript_12316:400-1242(-)